MKINNNKGYSPTRAIITLLLLATVVCVSTSLMLNTSEDVEGDIGVEHEGITYTVRDNEDYATVTATEETLTGVVTILSSVNIGGEDYDVERIGIEAFKGRELEKIILPSCITCIERGAFSGCTKLEEIDIEKNSKLELIGQDAFKGCTGLTSFSIDGQGIVESGYITLQIARGAFTECVNIATVSINGVNLIAIDVFYACTGLKTVNLSNMDTENGVFEGRKSITKVNIENVTTIDDDAFEGCENLVDLSLSGVETISKDAFMNCIMLKKVIIPESVKKIGAGAFWSCTSLETITFEGDSKLTTMEKEAFWHTALTEITIPNRVEVISDDTFNTCKSLTSVSMNSVTEVGSRAFLECERLTSISMGNVTKLGEQVFDGCAKLVNINIDRVEVIEKYTFKDCTKLANVSMDKVKKIGDSAFEGCGFTELVIKGNETIEIAQSAFMNCSNLSTIDLTNVKLGDQVFDGCKIKTVVLTDVASIPQLLFLNITTIENVKLNRVETIGEQAFEGCTGLKTLELTDVKTIKRQGFKGCTTLGTLDLAGVETIGYEAFHGCGFTMITISGDMGSFVTIPQFAFGDCKALQTATLSNVEVGGYAFENCTKMTSASLSSVGTVDGFAFNNCTGLENVSFDGVELIDTLAFNNCSALESVAILSSLGTIRNNAFDSIATLTSLAIPAKVGSINDSAFYECENLKTITISGQGDGNTDIFSEYFATDEWKIGGSAVITTLIIDTADEINIDNVKIVNDKILKIMSKSTKVTGATDMVIFDGKIVSGEKRAGDDKTYTGKRDLWIGGDEDVEVSVAITPDIGGSVSGGTKYLVGNTVELEASENRGYEFIEWIDANDESLSDDKKYTFVIKENTAISAVFRLIPVELTLSAEPDEYGTVSGDGIYNFGDLAKATATPNEGYKFVGWVNDRGVVSTESTYSFIIEADTELKAMFEIIILTLSARADPFHYGTITGTGTYEYGTSAKITAIPDQGYRFVAWSDGNMDGERHIRMTTDVHLTAYFTEYVPDTCSIIVIIEGNGFVYGAGTYEKGSIISLTASPENGHSFQKWSHTSYKGMTIDVSVESDMVITATFTSTNAGIGGSSSSTIDTTTAIVIVVVIVVIFGIIVAVSLIRGRRSD